MRNLILFMLIVVAAMLTGCSRLNVNSVSERLQPSNDRDWIAELHTPAFAEVDGDQITLKNIRSNRYLTNDDYVVNHYDRTININQIQSVDYVVVPFNNTPQIAHTLLSFGLDNGTYLGVSVEVRREKGEGYSAWRGLTRQLELMYVLADERDLIGVRTSHRDSDVYIYPTVATPKQAQALFQSIVARMNKLAADPEFYHTITNNCTTNLKLHVNELSPNRVPLRLENPSARSLSRVRVRTGLTRPANSIRRLAGPCISARRSQRKPRQPTVLSTDPNQTRRTRATGAEAGRRPEITVPIMTYQI